MPRILVVDDSATQAQWLAFHLEDSGFDVQTAADGLEALETIIGALESEDAQPFDAVVTDLQMPNMDGLQLVEGIRRSSPALPVVLITAHGNEEIAVQALQKGAASYVPKRILEEEIVPTLKEVLVVAPSYRQRRRLLNSMSHLEHQFVLENDPSMVPPLIDSFRDGLLQMGFQDETENLRMGVALREAMNNAIYHGNLEVTSDLREQDHRLFYDLAEERQKQSPYRDRHVHVRISLTPSQAICAVLDEGPGFDPDSLPDPLAPENLEKASGRGLLLIRTFMDQVRHNEIGNEITMVKDKQQ